MPFEAKFLNLSADNYKISIVDPADNAIKESIELSETENKKMNCPFEKLNVILKNLTNTEEELTFELPECELYTIDMDFSKNATIIKSDKQGKRFEGVPTKAKKTTTHASQSKLKNQTVNSTIQQVVMKSGTGVSTDTDALTANNTSLNAVRQSLMQTIQTNSTIPDKRESKVKFSDAPEKRVYYAPNAEGTVKYDGLYLNKDQKAGETEPIASTNTYTTGANYYTSSSNLLTSAGNSSSNLNTYVASTASTQSPALNNYSQTNLDTDKFLNDLFKKDTTSSSTPSNKYVSNAKYTTSKSYVDTAPSTYNYYSTGDNKYISNSSYNGALSSNQSTIVSSGKTYTSYYTGGSSNANSASGNLVSSGNNQYTSTYSSKTHEANKKRFYDLTLDSTEQQNKTLNNANAAVDANLSLVSGSSSKYISGNTYTSTLNNYDANKYLSSSINVPELKVVSSGQTNNYVTSYTETSGSKAPNATVEYKTNITNNVSSTINSEAGSQGQTYKTTIGSKYISGSEYKSGSGLNNNSTYVEYASNNTNNTGAIVSSSNVTTITSDSNPKSSLNMQEVTNILNKYKAVGSNTGSVFTAAGKYYTTGSKYYTQSELKNPSTVAGEPTIVSSGSATITGNVINSSSNVVSSGTDRKVYYSSNSLYKTEADNSNVYKTQTPRNQNTVVSYDNYTSNTAEVVSSKAPMGSSIYKSSKELASIAQPTTYTSTVVEQKSIPKTIVDFNLDEYMKNIIKDYQSGPDSVLTQEKLTVQETKESVPVLEVKTGLISEENDSVPTLVANANTQLNKIEVQEPVKEEKVEEKQQAQEEIKPEQKAETQQEAKPELKEVVVQEVKPVEVFVQEVKPVEVVVQEVRPVEVVVQEFKPVEKVEVFVQEAKPVEKVEVFVQEFKPVEVVVQEVKPVEKVEVVVQEVKPVEKVEVVVQEFKPVEVVVQEFKPVEVVVQEAKPVEKVEVVVQEVKPVEVFVQEAKPVEVFVQEVKPVEVFVQEVKPVEVVVQEFKPVEVVVHEIKSEQKQDTVEEIKPEEKKQIIKEIIVEAKPEEKQEIAQEHKPEEKQEAPQEIKLEEKKEETHNEIKPEEKLEIKPEEKQESAVGIVQEIKPEVKQEVVQEIKTDIKQEILPKTKPEEKQEEPIKVKCEDKQEIPKEVKLEESKPEQKTEEKAETQPELKFAEEQASQIHTAVENKIPDTNVAPVAEKTEKVEVIKEEKIVEKITEDKIEDEKKQEETVKKVTKVEEIAPDATKKETIKEETVNTEIKANSNPVKAIEEETKIFEIASKTNSQYASPDINLRKRATMSLEMNHISLDAVPLEKRNSAVFGEIVSRKVSRKSTNEKIKSPKVKAIVASAEAFEEIDLPDVTNKKQLLALNFENMSAFYSAIKKLEKTIIGIIYKNNEFNKSADLLTNGTKSDISFKNQSNKTIYVRVSGESQEQEQFEPVKPNESVTFSRLANKIHKLQISLIKNSKKGAVFNVFPGCAYTVDRDLKLIDISGTQVNLSCSRFVERAEAQASFNNKFFTFLKQENFELQFLKRLLNDKYICFINGTAEEITIRLRADENSDDDLYAVYPSMALLIQRKPEAEYLTEIKTNKRIFKYILQTNNVYLLDGELTLVKAQNGNEIVEAVEQGNKLTNNVRRNRAETLSLISKKIEKEKGAEDLYFNFEETEIDEENLNEFNVENSSEEEIFVKIEQKSEGTDEFFALKNGSDVWTIREDGLFLLEIVRANLTSKRYIIHTSYCYFIDTDFNLRESVSKKLIHTTIERFESSKLVCGKINAQINYNADEKLKGLENEDEEDEAKHAYFKDVKPKFTRGKKYTDDAFPARATSLTAVNPLNKRRLEGNNPHSAEKIDENVLSCVAFKRPEEIFKANESVFLFNENNTNEENVHQTYLSSIIACLQQNPALIRHCFKTQEHSKDGFYELFYYENGVKKVIFVDDQLPVLTKDPISNNEKVYFSEPKANEIWLPLLEKAYAKYEGGYANIQDGNVLSEIYFFTGAISHKFSTKDLSHKAIWDNLISNANNSALVLSGFNDVEGSKTKEILCQITYTVLNSYEFDNGSEIVKLIKMKNPAGAIEWLGEYKKDSQKWTAELKKYVDADSAFKETGVFFLSLDEFIDQFDFFVATYAN